MSEWPVEIDLGKCVQLLSRVDLNFSFLPPWFHFAEDSEILDSNFLVF